MSRLRRALTSLLAGAENHSPRRGRLLLEQLESRQMMAGDVDLLYTSGATDSGSSSDSAFFATTATAEGEVTTQSHSVSFVAIGNQNVAIGSPLHIPVDVTNPGSGPVTITVEVADPSLLEAVVLSGNRSIRMSVADYGDMVFELFEQRAPRPALRVIELAESGFYDGTIFHRIIDNFVIQGGDPTGTGSGGSPLGNFADQYHRDLQHNRTGILSFAKSTDDTNNSQFFITEGPQRTLDFNHSVFGQLVEGEQVREAISEIADLANKETNSADRPLVDIVIDSVSVFQDDQNAVVMLKPKGNQTGTTTVKFTATTADGSTFSEEVTVSVVADSGTGSNSAPFLGDITAPASVPNTAPATLQLSSTDVEGDPVEYFGSTSTSGVTATVNATTGLVTVTPSAGFVGAATVTVGVRPAPGVSGALANQSDTQQVVFNFVNEQQSVAAPTSIDLAAASDSGASNSDNLTRTGSLTFNVAGVQNGAEVVVFAGSVEIGRAIAQGTTAAVTTNNLAALGDGSYQITARQIVGSQTSSASPALAVTYDATPPVRVQNFPLAANVGVPLQVNLHHPEEGAGLVYAFTSAPQGATINAQSGVISWTPTSQQVGAHDLTLTLTDPAGNVRSETFTVNVADTPLAGTRLEITDLNGNVITQVDPNQEFLLHFYAIDRRGVLDRAGVFAAFTDILFDSSLVTPVTSTPIQYGPDFGSIISSGSFGTGVIDELGAVANSLAQTDEDEGLIATVRMRAVGEGTATFISEPADVSGNDVLLYNEDTAVPDELVTFGRTSVLVGARFSAVNDTFTVPQGSAATTLDVLANDAFAAGTSGTLTLTSLTTPSAGGTATIQNGQVRYRPAATFVGTETFDYVVTDNTGVARTATVSVTVTSDSAPDPTAVNDAFTVVEDAALATFEVLTNDVPSSSGQTISVTAVGTASQGGTVELGPNGQSIRYRPAANFTGTETVSYTITDSAGGTATATATFTVTAVNDAPPAANITRDVFRGATGTTGTTVATLSDFGTNVDGNETLTVAIVGTPTGGGTFSVDGTTIRYTPASATFVGTDTVSYTTTDAGGLSSTGTLTVNVLDSLPTNFKLSLQNNGRPARINSNFSATLTGTTSSGQSINRSVSLNDTDGVIDIENLSAGDYQIEVPAIPFLSGMDQPQQIAFTADPAGGELSGSINVGSLHSSFLRLEDFFSSSSRNTLFAVVTPGSDSLLTLGQDRTSVVVDPTVNLNADASSVTIRGNTAAGAATQATLPTTDARFETRGVDGDLRLVKVNLAGVTFAAPPTSSSGQSNSASANSTTPQGSETPPQGSETTAEGESLAAATNNPFAAPAGGEGERLNDGSPAQDALLSHTSEDDHAASRRLPNDTVLEDDTDPRSHTATQTDGLSGEGEQRLPPEAVDAFLATLEDRN